MKNSIEKSIMLHVHIHSHPIYGTPCGIQVLGVKGSMDMEWFYGALNPVGIDLQAELAEQFYMHSGHLDSSAWYLCQMYTKEVDDDTWPQHAIEIINRFTDAA